MYKTSEKEQLRNTGTSVVVDSYNNEVRDRILLDLILSGLMVRKATIPDPYEYEVVVVVTAAGNGKKSISKVISIPMTMDDLNDMKEDAPLWNGDVLEVVTWNIIVSICQNVIESFEHKQKKEKQGKPTGFAKKQAFQSGVDCFNSCPYGYACDVCPKYIPAQNTY